MKEWEKRQCAFISRLPDFEYFDETWEIEEQMYKEFEKKRRDEQ